MSALSKQKNSFIDSLFNKGCNRLAPGLSVSLSLQCRAIDISERKLKMNFASHRSKRVRF